MLLKRAPVIVGPHAARPSAVMVVVLVLVLVFVVVVRAVLVVVTTYVVDVPEDT